MEIEEPDFVRTPNPKYDQRTEYLRIASKMLQTDDLYRDYPYIYSKLVALNDLIINGTDGQSRLMSRQLIGFVVSESMSLYSVGDTARYEPPTIEN